MQTNSYATPKSEDSVKKFDLKEAMSPLVAKIVPETYDRGLNAIHTIIISTRLEILNGGYSKFGTGIDSSDHGVVWFDITEEAIFGEKPQTLKTSKPIE